MAEIHHVQHVVVPGTFDPVTLGHVDVIKRARKLFPVVTVAVAESRTKRGVGTAFTLEERVRLLQDALADEGLSPDRGVEVRPFTGLLVDFCREVGAGGVVKGLRAMTDFEYELQQADLNSHMAPDLESVFVMSSPQYTYVSSSIVREIASLGQGHDLTLLVPPNVARALERHYATGV